MRVDAIEREIRISSILARAVCVASKNRIALPPVRDNLQNHQVLRYLNAMVEKANEHAHVACFRIYSYPTA
jgi:hypothetical protein